MVLAASGALDKIPKQNMFVLTVASPFKLDPRDIRPESGDVFLENLFRP